MGVRGGDILPTGDSNWSRRGCEVEFTAPVRDEQNKKLEVWEVKVCPVPVDRSREKRARNHRRDRPISFSHSSPFADRPHGAFGRLRSPVSGD